MFSTYGVQPSKHVQHINSIVQNTTRAREKNYGKKTRTRNIYALKFFVVGGGVFIFCPFAAVFIHIAVRRHKSFSKRHRCDDAVRVAWECCAQHSRCSRKRRTQRTYSMPIEFATNIYTYCGVPLWATHIMYMISCYIVLFQPFAKNVCIFSAPFVVHISGGIRIFRHMQFATRIFLHHFVDRTFSPLRVASNALFAHP